MIVSHHGEYEYGSPELPMTVKTVALRHLDSLDAKVRGFQRQNTQAIRYRKRWTLFDRQLARKLYKGQGINQSP